MNEKTRKLVATAILSGIAVVMSFPFVGTLALPLMPAAASIAFLPVMVAAIMLGFWPGVAVAIVAGAASLIRAFIIPTMMAPFFMNPLVSMIPRILVAITVWVVFNAMVKIAKDTKGAKITVMAGISGAIGSIANTFFVLGSVYLFYAAPLASDGGTLMSPSLSFQTDAFGLVGFTLFGVATTNGLAELIINTILVAVLVTALTKARFGRIFRSE